jgi:tRNA A37 threonylcarbamoyladenosine synthetase subunit TsaC/SUA5/YrdC
MPALKHSWQVAKQFAEQLDYLLPGPLGKQQHPSEIRDLATGKVIRQG